jgi:hypothetical protein
MIIFLIAVGIWLAFVIIAMLFFMGASERRHR